jgi:hypothetical protein
MWTAQTGYVQCVPHLRRPLSGLENGPIFGVRSCSQIRVSVLFFSASPFCFFSLPVQAHNCSPVQFVQSDVEAHAVLNCLWDGSGACSYAVCGESDVHRVGHHDLLWRSRRLTLQHEYRFVYSLKSSLSMAPVLNYAAAAPWRCQ